MSSSGVNRTASYMEILENGSARRIRQTSSGRQILGYCLVGLGSLSCLLATWGWIDGASKVAQDPEFYWSDDRIVSMERDGSDNFADQYGMERDGSENFADPYGVEDDSYGAGFDCETSLDVGAVVKSEQKGVAIDDTSLENCAAKTPVHWPNTKEKIQSARLFKVWGMTHPKFFRGDMKKAWVGLKTWAKAAGGKFLIGVSLTCRTGNDDKEFKAALEFIKYVGAEHIMGLAVGNEIDLQVGAGNPICVGRLWNGGGYIDTLKRRVREFDKIPGMQELPITAVFSNNAMGGSPFTGKVTNFIKAAYRLYGNRYVFSINVYPQFSHGLHNAGCSGAANIGTKFTNDKPAGFTPAVGKELRNKLQKAGLGTVKLWLGETGWATHAYCVLGCGQACHSKATQMKYYHGFLKWDLMAEGSSAPCGPAEGNCAKSVQWAKTAGILEHPEWYPGLSPTSHQDEFQKMFAKKGEDGCTIPCGSFDEERALLKRVDHVFYFTLRDSAVFGKREEFGLISSCGSTKCKF